MENTLEDLDSKILYLYYLIYNINENDKDELLSLLLWLKNEDKKEIIIFLYKRYEEDINNSKTIIQTLKKIENKVDEWIEKYLTEEIIFNF